MRPTLLFFLFALAHLGCHSGRSTTTDSVSPDAVEIESSCIATFEGSIERSPALTPEDEIIVAIEPFDGKGVQLARVSIDGARIWQVEVTALGWRLASPPVSAPIEVW